MDTDAIDADKVDSGGRDGAHYAVPDLVFVNRTALDAMHFDTVDQYSNAVHVIVAKTAYTIGARDATGLAPLNALEKPAALNVEDVHFADDIGSAVRQECDLASFKPCCDVIVNGTAHAPRGTPNKLFGVRLTVRQAGKADAKTILINKTLHVFGERAFKRKAALLRLLHWTVKIATLGMLRPLSWRLSAPKPMLQLPVRYEFALGGECHISVGDAAAKRLPRSGPEAPAKPADGDAVARDSCPANPLGHGFTRRWFLDAKHVKQLPAPRIAYPKQSCSARQFWRGACGEDLPAPAGLGFVGRGWLPRLKLAGKHASPAAWNADAVPGLPADFDVAYWNGAPADQQCPYLMGEEEFMLTNLCRADHPGAHIDSDGNTVLRFTLPSQALFLLTTDKNNKLGVLRLEIDTVVIDPEAARVDLVWRAGPAANGAFLKAELIQASEPGQLARLQLMEAGQEKVGALPLVDAIAGAATDAGARP